MFSFQCAFDKSVSLGCNNLDRFGSFTLKSELITSLQLQFRSNLICWRVYWWKRRGKSYLATCTRPFATCVDSFDTNKLKIVIYVMAEPLFVICCSKKWHDLVMSPFCQMDSEWHQIPRLDDTRCLRIWIALMLETQDTRSSGMGYTGCCHLS